jgi:hypothetical protein
VICALPIAARADRAVRPLGRQIDDEDSVEIAPDETAGGGHVDAVLGDREIDL